MKRILTTRLVKHDSKLDLDLYDQPRYTKVSYIIKVSQSLDKIVQLGSRRYILRNGHLYAL